MLQQNDMIMVLEIIAVFAIFFALDMYCISGNVNLVAQARTLMSHSDAV